MPLGTPFEYSSGPFASGHKAMYGSIAGFRFATGV